MSLIKILGDEEKVGIDDTIPAVMPNEMSSKESRQNWARLIQKIYMVNYIQNQFKFEFFQTFLTNINIVSLFFSSA